VSGIAVSAGAVAGSAPLVAFNFGQFPILSIPATLLALPLVPVLLVTGILTALAAEAAPLLGTAAGAGPILAAGWVVGIAAFFGPVSWAAPGVTFLTHGWVWSAYAVFAGLFAVAHRRRWLPGARTILLAIWQGLTATTAATGVIAPLGLVAAAPVAAISLENGDGLLHAYFLDVGQGDATLIVTPAGGTILIDGGPDPRVTIDLLDGRLPPGASEIDLVVLTHPHGDHLNGVMELARRGRAKWILVPPLLHQNDRAWRDELDSLGVLVTQGVRGTTVRFDDGVLLEVLHPLDPPLRGTASDVDNNGLVLRVGLGERTVLLTGDLFVDSERVLLDAQGDVAADVLKAGHHGSGTSTGVDLVRAASPDIAVISEGEDNRFGHPASEVVARLVEAVSGPWVFETARNGTIELTTDGTRWWAKTDR
jgi:beta-lactamase superfamily II metal-dependent hydrolase